MTGEEQPRLRVFFDSNVLLSAFINEGLSRALWRRAVVRAFDAIISRQVLDEVSRHLPRVTTLDKAEQAVLVGIIRATADVVETPRGAPQVCRDPSDDPILAAALAAQADVLVTGDKDLLVLERCQRVEILTPATLLRRLETASGS